MMKPLFYIRFALFYLRLCVFLHFWEEMFTNSENEDLLNSVSEGGSVLIIASEHPHSM